ncbi:MULTISPECIES: hypothetical protein [unclassified Variovorax]|uniref:hypothetical protein n=1 Tax=unclassified Variovorax TaxID=663243 RepID=UPI003ECDE19E
MSAENTLAINASGQEVLRGLTFDESQFLIDCAGQPPKDAAQDRGSELALKHEKAWLRIATVDEESTSDEERPPIVAKF